MQLLFNWLTPLTTVMASQESSLSSRNSPTKAPKTFFEAALQAPPPVLLDLVSSVADDVATLGLMGVLGKRTGEKAAQFANWCWFLSTLVGLVENGVERQMIGSLQHEGSFLPQVCFQCNPLWLFYVRMDWLNLIGL
jgi:hypothetical protein